MQHLKTVLTLARSAILASKVDGKEADRKCAIKKLRSEQQEL